MGLVAIVARTHVVLADDVIEAIDERVGHRGRSRFLEEAAQEKLHRLELEAAIRKTAGIASETKYPEWKDRQTAADWVRAERHSDAKS